MNRFNRLINKPYKLHKRGGKLRNIQIRVLTRFIRWYYHCDIPCTVDVSGVYFCHKGFGVVINPKVVLGKRVVIQHCVTIGENDGSAPIIGDDVYIGAKSTIIGGVKIGNKAKIGAGAVVITDVPTGCTAVGVPAKIIKFKNNEI